MKNKLILETEGILYKNPFPAYRAEYAFQPNLAVLSDKELLCVYRVGQAYHSADGMIAKTRSTDNGNTWQTEGLVWNAAKDRELFNYDTPHVSKLRDGTLLLTCSRRPQKSGEITLLCNPRTKGLHPWQIALFRSNDNGRSWSGPEVLNLPGENLIDVYSPIIELDSGRLFLACEKWKDWDDESQLHVKGFAMFSDDCGQSWKDRLDFPSVSDEKIMYSHTRYCRTSDGGIFGLQWAQEVGSDKNLGIYYVKADPSARKWSFPEPTGIMAEPSWPAHLGGEFFAAACCRREREKPGIFVVLSQDGGKSWDLEQEVMVWDALGQSYLGPDEIPPYPSSHDNIAFSKPGVFCLSDGRLICSWWCTQACVTHSRFAQLRVVNAN